MKKSLLLMVCNLFVCGHALFANPENNRGCSLPPPVHSSFGYMDMGLGPSPLPVPSFGVGYRNQYSHHGFDTSLHVSTIVLLTQLKGSLLYHYYPKPCLHSQFYYGAGCGISTIFDGDKINKRKYLLSPEFVVGKSYLADTGGKRFFQAQVSWPTFTMNTWRQNEFSMSRPFYLPLVTFSYGIGF